MLIRLTAPLQIAGVVTAIMLMTHASADAQASEPMMGAGAAPAEASALLSLSFSGVSWVEVTDANGRVLVSQLARAGDVLQPAGAVPLAVVLGDATQVSATVRGAAFDLATFTRSNVARFTVKEAS